MQNSPYRRRKGIIFISVSSRNKKSIFCCRSRTLFYKERLETPSKDIFETKRTAWKERHCANGWRCFDFVQRLRERSIKKRITRHLNALDGQRPTSLSTCQNRRWPIRYSPPVEREQPLIRASILPRINPSEASTKKIYPRIMRKWTKEAPVSAVSIALFRCENGARLIQNGRQLNAMIKSLTVPKC